MTIQQFKRAMLIIIIIANLFSSFSCNKNSNQQLKYEELDIETPEINFLDDIKENPSIQSQLESLANVNPVDFAIQNYKNKQIFFIGYEGVIDIYPGVEIWDEEIIIYEKRKLWGISDVISIEDQYHLMNSARIFASAYNAVTELLIKNKIDIEE